MPCSSLLLRCDAARCLPYPSTHFLGVRQLVAGQHASAASYRPIKPRGPISSARPRDSNRLNDQISPNSLQETVENHRTANLANRIRSIDATADTDVLRPLTSEPTSPASVSQSQGLGEDAPVFSSLPQDFVAETARQVKRLAIPGQSMAASMRRNAAPAKTRRQGHIPEFWISKNGYLRKSEQFECMAARRMLLNAYGDGNDVVNERSEELWKDQMAIMRRTRQVMYANMEDIVQDPEMRKKASKGILEYIGHWIDPKHCGVLNPGIEPWMSDKRSKDQRLDRLDDEINRFMDWIQPTEVEKNARSMVLSQTLNVIQQCVPTLSARVFGSSTTGLAMPTSDIDIRLYHPQISIEFAKTPLAIAGRSRAVVSGLNLLADSMRSHSDYTLVVVRDTRFPLLSAQHVPSGLSLQIVGGPPTYGSRAVILHYLSKYPTLKTLFTVIKTAFDVRGLSDVWTGGLGSYSIFIMIVTVLNLRARQRLEATLANIDALSSLRSQKKILRQHNVDKLQSERTAATSDTVSKTTISSDGAESDSSSFNVKDNHAVRREILVDTFQLDRDIETIDTPAMQLLHFLRFWGTEFNPYAFGIRASTATLFPKRPRPRADDVAAAAISRVKAGQIHMAVPVMHSHYLLCLQDPADPYNDLGRKSFAFKHIQQTLRYMYRGLKAMTLDMPRGHVEAPFLRSVVGRCDVIYDSRRAMLELFGEGDITGADGFTKGVGSDAEQESMREDSVVKQMNERSWEQKPDAVRKQQVVKKHGDAGLDSKSEIRAGESGGMEADDLASAGNVQSDAENSTLSQIWAEMERSEDTDEKTK